MEQSREWVLSNLSKCVKYKSLWNQAERIQGQIIHRFLNNNLMFTCEDEETKESVHEAIKCLDKFKQNLRLKPKYADLLKK